MSRQISAPARSRVAAIARRLLAPLLLVAASFAFVAANAPAHEELSVFDEFVYIDYLAKVPEQGLVVRGEETGDLAREAISCDGVQIYGRYAPERCGTGDYSNDADFPYGGATSADIYTPLYFWGTWAVAQPIMWVSGTDLVGAGRLAGGVWLAGAALLLFAALGRLGLSRTMRVAAPLLMIVSLPAWWSNTYVSTDGTALFSGALVLLLGVRTLQTGRGSWLLVAASVLAVTLKIQNLMAVAAVAGALLIAAMRRASGPPAEEWRPEPGVPDPPVPPGNRRRNALTALAMLVAPVVVQIGWVWLRSRLAVGPVLDQGIASPAGPEELLRESFRFLGDLGLISHISQDAVLGWGVASLVSWLLVAGVLGAFAVGARGGMIDALALGTLVVALTGGPALALATAVVEGHAFALPPRYGVSLVPLALALAAWLFDRKASLRYAMLVLAAGAFLLSLTPYYPGSEIWG